MKNLLLRVSIILLSLFFYVNFLSAQELNVKKNANNDIMVEPLNTSLSVFFGKNAGINNTGSQNTFIGNSAGLNNTQGQLNTFVGLNAGLSNTIGSQNTFIGNSAGLNNTQGQLNTFVGQNAGLSNTIGSNNTFIGNQAGLNNTEGQVNTFVGLNAGVFNTTGSQNTFIGNSAGQNNTEGQLNTFVGLSAGKNNTEGQSNTFIGSASGFANQTGLQNTFMGQNAGAANTSTHFNTIIGSFAGPVATGTSNTFLGQAAGNLTTTGSNNTFLGRNAGSGNIIGSGSVFLGFNAGSNETSSNRLYIANSNVGQTDALIYGEFDNKTLRFNGTTGINKTFLGTTFNVRSIASDFILFNSESSDGTVRFTVAQAGYAGLNGLVSNTTLNLKSITGHNFILNAQNDSGNDKFSVKASGDVLVADSLGIGVVDPESQLHIKDGNKPRILIQSDGENEESGRLSLRQSNGTGADILYDGNNSQDAFAVETFISGNSNGRKLMVDLAGHVGINAKSNYIGLNVRSVPNDIFILNVQDDAGTDRFSVSPEGHAGINHFYSDVGLNVRSVPNDYYILNVQDDAGANRFMVTPDGHAGVNAQYNTVGLNVRSVPNDIYILNVQDDAGTDRFSIEPNGEVFIDEKLGIGEGSPEGQLHITSNDGAKLILEADADNGNELDNPVLEFRQDGGATIAKIGYDEAEYGSNIFAIADVASNKYVLINEDGDVGINVVPGLIGSGGEGNYNFVSGSKLSVRGRISATEFNQINIGSWPDYVFEDDYELMPLSEIEASIEKNKHLPGIPSAAEVKENGLKLGAMQVKMMEKIEELTLHLIEMNKKVEAQEAEIKSLKASRN